MRERENWLREKRLEEWKELLSNLANTLVLAAEREQLLRDVEQGNREFSSEAVSALTAAVRSLILVMGTRIFVAQQFDELELGKHWQRAQDRLDDRDLVGFTRELEELHVKIVKAALDC
jgi:hypothetical protein